MYMYKIQSRRQLEKDTDALTLNPQYSMKVLTSLLPPGKKRPCRILYSPEQSLIDTWMSGLENSLVSFVITSYLLRSCSIINGAIRAPNIVFVFREKMC